MPSITELSASAEASHVILLISGSDYFLIKVEFMKKAHSHSDPGSKYNHPFKRLLKTSAHTSPGFDLWPDCKSRANPFKPEFQSIVTIVTIGHLWSNNSNHRNLT